MAITMKEKELAAVGIAVATGCQPCTDYHMKEARKAGAFDKEIKEAVGCALSVHNRATQAIEEYALAQLGKKAPMKGLSRIWCSKEERTRIKALVSVGSAFGINCVVNLDKHLAEAQSVGISQDDIAEIEKLAEFIKSKAASHANRFASVLEARGGEEDVAAYRQGLGGSC